MCFSNVGEKLQSVESAGTTDYVAATHYEKLLQKGEVTLRKQQLSSIPASYNLVVDNTVVDNLIASVNSFLRDEFQKKYVKFVEKKVRH